MRIQNNITAENSHRQIGINTHNLSKNTEKLSSGFRVNRAADDAAGLAISEKMRTQIRGLNRASLNIQDGISLLQVGDGALQSVHDIMQRLRELSVQAANDTNQLMDREAIQLEFGQMTSEIQTIISQTDFNGRTLFDGSIGASWEYNLGRVTQPFVASMPANNDVAPTGANVAGWAPLPGFGTAAHVPGVGFPFPSDGIFAMQIVTPANGTLNVIMDFAAMNSGGAMTRAEFEDFFKTGFNSLGLGDVVSGVRIENNFINIDFPQDQNGTLTGVMGRLPDPMTWPVPPQSWPTVQIGAGGTNQDQINALNGIPSTDYPGPFLTYKPYGTTPIADGNFKNTELLGLPNVTGTAAFPPGIITPAVSGGFPNVSITVDGRETVIYLVPGHYPDAESFIEANQRAFETAMPRGFELDVDPENPNRLIIATKIHAEGTATPVLPTIGQPIFNPTTLGTELGFSGTISIGLEPVPAGSLIIQSGANRGDEIGIEMPRLCTRSIGISIRRPEDTRGPEDGGFRHINDLEANGYTTKANVAGDPPEYSLDVTSHEKASAALGVLTNAINIISTERARIGAQQNRLESTMANVDNTSENLQAAESRIRDIDMAKEMTMFTKNQILQQSSTAMLAQANALPQGVLQLLG